MPTSRLALLPVLFTLAGVALAALVLSACGDGGPDTAAVDGGADPGTDEVPDPAADPAPAGGGGAGPSGPSPVGDWVLDRATVDGAVLEVPVEPVELRLAAGEIGGSGGCNQFGGGVELGADGSFTTFEVAITEMACVGPSMGFEAVYVDGLFRATAFAVTPDGLVLSGEGVELAYRPAAPAVNAPLSGTTWRFDTVFSGQGVERAASTARLDKPEVTLVVGEGEGESDAVLASADCGSVTLMVIGDDAAGGAVSFETAPDAGPACDDPESNLLAAYDGLVAATGFQIVEQRLTFIGFEGETVGFVAKG